MRPPFPIVVGLWERIVADRLLQGWSKSAPPPSMVDAGARRRKRALAAFATGAALFAVGWIALQSEQAGAAGDPPGFLGFLSGVLNGRQIDATRLVEMPIEPEAPRPAKHKVVATSPLASRRPVCVRLCDGYFFPAGVSERGSQADQQANCSALCPGATTSLYYLPPGSDRIEDASSSSGQRYTALPAALRYRTTNDHACTCQATAAQTPYWRDPTLRKGDAVMTADGFMIYQGAPHSPFGHANFTRLAATSMPQARRAALTAIERVSVLTVRETARPQIMAAAPSAKAGGANEIRFVGKPASVTN